MEVGMGLIFQNPKGTRTDAELYADELTLADQAEGLGFESLWTIEHHFTDYSLSPDPIQFLTYMAGRTERVKLGTMVVVLPWHDPVRVAESVSVLDIVSGGRAILGIGRGLGRIEFEGFRVPMEESRDRFLESAQLVTKALETGTCQLDGLYVKQPERALRPACPRSFVGRTYAASVSPESSKIMAELGLGILIVPQKPYAQVAEDLQRYQQEFLAHNGTEPPPTAGAVWVYCHQDEDWAAEAAHQYIGDYYESTMAHYELAGAHFAKTKGYEYYEKTSSILNRDGADAAKAAFVDYHVYGTPEQCFEKIKWIQSIINNDKLMAIFSYSGMPLDEAEGNMKLFASEVMPELKRLPLPAAAEA
jgi:alkanesulfonate monooxygenase SsuD/methylene tetrahydromethanopterin reductase-like flavin-dependent oxidoreductase (luciferase family)